jgi:hypothetical protein
VAETLVDNMASLSLIMRKTFIEMSLNLADLTPVHDTFHGVILGQSSTPIGCIDLKVSRGTGDNKHREMLTFEVISFNISYNCIYTGYATMKMPGPKGVITIMTDQRDTLACENVSLSHVGHFSDKTAKEQSAKVAKTQGGSTPLKTSASKSPIGGTPRAPSAKKGTYVASPYTQQPIDQLVDDKKNGTALPKDKEILADPSNSDKKLWINTTLNPK